MSAESRSGWKEGSVKAVGVRAGAGCSDVGDKNVGWFFVNHWPDDWLAGVHSTHIGPAMHPHRLD